MLTLIKEGAEYILDDGSIAWYIGDEGWGMEPITRYSEHGPLQEGDTDKGSRAKARYGKLMFELVAENRTALFHMRENLMTLFNPKMTLQLRWDLPMASGGLIEWQAISRQFDVVYAGDMDFPSSQRIGYAQKTVVTLKASDPTCYDPALALVTFAGGGGSGMVVPIHLGDASGLFFGMSAMNNTQTITNMGNADDYPEITIVGPITNPKITNVGYGEKLDFTGTTIAAGVTYVIDLRYGYKTVIELPSTNRIDQLTDDSDISTWRLRPGANDVKVEGSGITSATKVQIRHHHRYLGV